jgi:hypothetical protein
LNRRSPHTGVPLAAAVLTLVVTLACGSFVTPITPTPTISSGSLFQLATSTPAPSPQPARTTTPLPTPLPTPVPLPTATPDRPWLPGDVRVFPGPLHYEGDVLTFEVVVHNLDDLENDEEITIALDDQQIPDTRPFRTFSQLREDVLVFSQVWDTTGQVGMHKVTVRLPESSSSVTPEISVFVEILDASEQPAQERQAVWTSLQLDCCVVHYMTGTAAARDIDTLADLIETNVAEVRSTLNVFPMRGRLPIVLIDNLWGNGAYSENAIVISYIDRAYNALDFEMALRHETTHQMERAANRQAPAILAEGLAVTVAGGHYHPENVPVRAAALLRLDDYVPLADLTGGFARYQHELAYIEAGALTTYLVETYGWDRFLSFYRTNVRDSRNVAWLEAALARHFGIDLETLEADFIAWLESQPVDDADLQSVQQTVELYETMRRYQDLFAPYQERLPELDSAFENNLTAPFIREATAPENLALETLLISAHQAHREERFADCTALLQAINMAMDDGDFSRPPVSDYVSIARRAGELGYEVQRIDLAGDEATVQAIMNWPQIETLTFARSGEEWDIAR